MSAAVEASYACVHKKYTAYEYYIAKRVQSILDTDGDQHECDINFNPFPITPLRRLHHYAGYV
jgi:hypothetical protein